MTIPFIRKVSKNTLATWMACATVAVATSASAAPPQPLPKAAPTKADKAAATKAKPRTRPASKATKPPAKTATKTAAKATPATGDDTRAASAKPSQVMDFDTDQVEGQRLEPGFELIEGAPRKARHRSLVEPLKPSDSVVRGE